MEKNVAAMIVKVKSTKLLTTGLKNSLQSLSGKLAKPEQEKDLLSFWEVGLEQFENKVKYFVLRDPYAKVPQKQVKLLTYTTSKPAKMKIKMIEREKKIVNKCVRRLLAWNAKVDSNHQQHGGQCLELPRAISNPHGRAHRGTKSYATKWLEKRVDYRGRSCRGDVFDKYFSLKYAPVHERVFFVPSPLLHSSSLHW